MPKTDRIPRFIWCKHCNARHLIYGKKAKGKCLNCGKTLRDALHEEPTNEVNE